LKTDIYLAFYDNRQRCKYVHRIIQFFTWSNISHVALIFDYGSVAITPMVLTGSSPKVFTETNLNKKAKLIYKHYMGNIDYSLDDVLTLCLKHRVSTVLKEIFAFTIGRYIGIYPSNCCTLAVDFLNTQMNYNYKNKYNPKKLMKEVYDDSNYDCRTS